MRYMSGFTIKNQIIRGTTTVGEIAKKVQERRLKRYEHVVRKWDHYVGRRAMEMKVQGRTKKGRLERIGLEKIKMISKGRDCRLMMCTTVLHGGA